MRQSTHKISIDERALDKLQELKLLDATWSSVSPATVVAKRTTADMFARRFPFKLLVRITKSSSRGASESALRQINSKAQHTR